MRRFGLLLAFSLTLCCVRAEIQVINGQRYECKDGLCQLVEEPPKSSKPVEKPPCPADAIVSNASRLAQGYMSADAFVAFLEDDVSSNNDSLWTRTGGSVLLILLVAFVGGLAMNLTPCVLPLVPVNLLVIGKSASRGLAYGLGIALAYGSLGLAAALGGLAFGQIQANPLFNLFVAAVFILLGLALFDVWFLDFSRLRGRAQKRIGATGGLFFAFAMGALAAVLAGACVAPILIAVLVLTADLVAKGTWLALGLPFVLGLGMAAPWPFAAAGLKVLPKPGAWMKHVNRAFALAVFALAAWHGFLAYRGWTVSTVENHVIFPNGSVTPKTFSAALAQAKRPVLVDCWASWCKNCAAMDRVLAQPKVRKSLAPYTLIRLQAEDITELRQLGGFGSVKGLPAFAIFE